MKGKSTREKPSNREEMNGENFPVELLEGRP